MSLRATRQKKLIESELTAFSTFFDADSLHRRVLKKDTSIGIATVYRFLKHAVDNGTLHSYSCGRKTIYSRDERSHCHFRCEKCGEVSHITIKNVDWLQNNIAGHVCHFQLDITGTCERCLKKK